MAKHKHPRNNIVVIETVEGDHTGKVMSALGATAGAAALALGMALPTTSQAQPQAAASTPVMGAGPGSSVPPQEPPVSQTNTPPLAATDDKRIMGIEPKDPSFTGRDSSGPKSLKPSGRQAALGGRGDTKARSPRR